MLVYIHMVLGGDKYCRELKHWKGGWRMMACAIWYGSQEKTFLMRSTIDKSLIN